MKFMWALVFIAVGVAVLIYGIGLVRDTRTCQQWPHVIGEVISAEVQTVAKEKNRTTYAPNVTYRYVVDGKSYKSSRLTLVPRNATSPNAAQAMLSRFPIGGAVTVFHDPGDSTNAVLDITAAGTEWAYAIGGVLLVGVGLISLKGS